MKIQINGAQIGFRTAFIGFISLLSSSVISAVGFIIIASNNWVVFDSATAVFIILFVQWQSLGLTIAKTGIEQVVFAMVSENENTYLNPAKYVYDKALPLSGIFSLVVLYVFSPWAAFIAFSTILLDTYSLIIMADLNGRKKFKTTAISNLLNYPLFFVIIFTFNCFEKLSTTVTLSMFLLSSFVRWLWLKKYQIIQPGMKEVICKVNIEMGIQQALNYWLFRADQIILALVGLKMQLFGSLGMYVFMAKFPELVSGVVAIAGAVFFPRTYIKYPFDFQAIFNQIRKHVKFVFGYILVVALCLYIYINFWKGQHIPFYLLLPFLAHSLFIILANNITYSTLRQGYLQQLLSNLGIAVLAGLLVTVFVQFNLNAMTLSLIVPIQLLIFITMSFILKWGRTRELYG
jgi:hypothetical protein